MIRLIWKRPHTEDVIREFPDDQPPSASDVERVLGCTPWPWEISYEQVDEAGVVVRRGQQGFDESWDDMWYEDIEWEGVGMAYIMRHITLEEVRAETPNRIWYGVNTCWWTHRQQDLRQHAGLPCDPRGGMLMYTDDPERFLDHAEKNPQAYGRHGMDAFLAAHNDNCVVSATDLRGTCLKTWDEYNDQLDEQEGGGQDEQGTGGGG